MGFGELPEVVPSFPSGVHESFVDEPAQAQPFQPELAVKNVFRKMARQRAPHEVAVDIVPVRLLRLRGFEHLCDYVLVPASLEPYEACPPVDLRDFRIARKLRLVQQVAHGGVVFHE